MLSSRRKHVQSTGPNLEPDFERHKSELWDLYVVQGKTRTVVSQIMKQNHDFQATKYQYEKAFGRWKWSKNVPASVWNAICPYLHHLKISNQEFDLFFHGEKVDQQRVFREMKKRPALDLSSSTVLQCKVPKGMAVVPRPTNLDSHLTHELPFESFERRAHISLPIRSDTPTTTTTTQTSTSRLDSVPKSSTIVPSRFDSHRRASQTSETMKLELIDISSPKLSAKTSLNFPTTRNPFSVWEPSVTDTDACIYSSLHHRKVLFLVANNFPGIDTVDQQLAIRLLDDGAGQRIHRLVKTTSNTYTMRAIMSSLFKTAIMTGHIGATRYMLGQASVNVYDGCLIDVPYRGKLTPIETAAVLRHVEVVKTLVDHETNFNGNRFERRVAHFQSALDCMFDKYTSPEEIRQAGKKNSKIVITLIAAGATLHNGAVTRILEANGFSMLVEIFKVFADRFSANWIENGFFGQLMWHCSTDVCHQMIDILNSTHRHLDCAVIKNHNGSEKFKLIDIMARRGCPDLMKSLLSKGAKLTESTLPLAVASGKVSVVHIALLHAQASHWTKEFVTSLISRAIEFGEEGRSILELVIETYGVQQLIDKQFSASSWQAAKVKGHAWMIEFLLHHGIELNDASLCHCLAVAIRHNSGQVTKLLIDLGVPLSTWRLIPASVLVLENAFNLALGIHRSIFESPFSEASRRRDVYVMRCLLDAGLDPYEAFRGSTPCTDSVIGWGDQNLIRLFIDAGLDMEMLKTFLSQATSSDIALVKFLCQSGVSPPHGALTRATLKGDLAMVQLLLEYGADPVNEEAFATAVKTNFQIFELLLNTYKDRYSAYQIEFDAVLLEIIVCAGNFDAFSYIVDCRLSLRMSTRASNGLFLAQPFAQAIEKAKKGDMRFVETFIQLGCSPEQIIRYPLTDWSLDSKQRENERWRLGTLRASAFLLVIMTKCTELVQLFLKHNADVNAPAHLGLTRTPLQAAAEHGCKAIVQLLINSGADVNIAAAHTAGGTAVQLAAIKGHNEIIIQLLNYGADVDAPPSKAHGRTALEGAAEHGRLDTVKVLLNAGAAQNGTNLKEINSAITYANKNGFPYIADMLKDHIANNNQNSPPNSFNMLDLTEEYFDWNRWVDGAMEIE